ncbi:hypothetical protein ABEG10_38415 (plasmid) [Burkholderia cenocepacia]|uniref:hypothetical protein n=1 Tax=Burkholderia cenocepacia TaxID=95486 RepID=UPI0020A0C5BD|nr:hypothetical protein [Burkholderia cenocepacia]MCO8402834.1 hypothetical protein [Burkholderia cenocepacia]MCO8415073.1 hypothetical protein [Burkholderia cenocepacia]MCO8423031.1 hypothetical protein [Burkholderia cenocepacia]MCO8474820.1 hypothetical protein [Burkholderia cenocepacia]MCO8482000.1 hypothetical protein [Burkholderia cenocepacia]
MTHFVISEPDTKAAVAHLRALPHSATASMPVEWSRKRFLDTLAATLRANPKAKGALAVGPGVWALVQPFGVDLAGTCDNDERQQVWILIRSCGTDPNRIETLAV